MRRLFPYLIIGLLILAPFVAAVLTSLPLATVQAGPPGQEGEGQPVTPESDFGTFVINIRLDLELLADEYLGPGIRPAGWNGNADLTSASIVGDVWLDLELLADEVSGEPGARPVGWAGASSTTPVRIARNLRHDLEQLASLVFGKGERPEDWIGAPAIYSCDITAQNLIDTERRTFEFRSTTPPSVVNYCQAVAGEAIDALAGQGVTVTEGNIPQLMENVRGDLERLADELNGLGVRPPGWRRTISLDTNEMSADLLNDLELLADQHLGENNRPPDWIGDLGLSPAIAVRNLRHDLELLAEYSLAGRDYLADLGGRPYGWLGNQGFGDAFTFCDTATQGLVLLLQSYYRFEIPSINAATQEGFCASLATAANSYAETDPERATEEELAGLVGASGKPIGQSDFAFAYLDVGALQFMGIMPRGIEFEAWYRNFGDSTMMYVVGENFAVYISYEWTTFPMEAFYRLPTLQGVIPETYCFAEWCAGPGPTPTPTGQAITPTPGGAPGEPPPGFDNLVLVPWNQIVIYYDQDKPETRSVLVRMELCARVGAGCEPVTNVYDATTNLPLPTLNLIGAYPVFELPYGYSNRFLMVSQTYFANEVWVSDPTLRGVVSGTGQ